MTTAPKWNGRKVTKARAYIASTLPQPCGQCGRDVMPGEEFVVGHVISRRSRPDLAFDPSNWRAEHRRCSDGTGQQVRIEAEDAESERRSLVIALTAAHYWGGLAQETTDTDEAARYRGWAADAAAAAGLPVPGR